MTPKEQAAMQQALEALVKCNHFHDYEDEITALREALAEQAEQEPFDMNDHPPHRLCECRKCMEYFTPLPDCDAFAAFGKPIAEQTNTQLMEGCRPVSEMVAEHKQDPKKAAAIEKAKMRKAEQKPVAVVNHEAGGSQKVTWLTLEGLADGAELYLHPVRTKDLTDDEIAQAVGSPLDEVYLADFRAVIAADREKNK